METKLWDLEGLVSSLTQQNSSHLKDRELRVLVLFLLIILEMRFSAALEYAAWGCFLRKLRVWEKIRSKFVKLWKMKKLTWERLVSLCVAIYLLYFPNNLKKHKRPNIGSYVKLQKSFSN